MLNNKLDELEGVNEQYITYIQGINRSTQELSEIMKFTRINEMDVEHDIFNIRMELGKFKRK